ncbi:ferric siderophore transport system inner membrane protein E [Alcanivorax balearicus MACL04]|uniref:Ferric siderophore transport system inner membrane protein E n=1 Tax=Alloalcanivorax balearicus MACL04 TaxID=1177182 RepID=A0ABT2QUQ9_9GAMM|nr:biopolymer transporter ExbD [Alloalcanivorax balearicus]MCU5781240.1 ferric siderophore transport system inner membrane protein E [Alloalcanivorax balearicus MACL04]
MNLEDNSPRRPPLEPVLPLINVVFLLLIFFMVAGQLAPRPTVDVTAPNSAEAATEEDPSQLMLILDKQGVLFHDGEPVAEASLATLIAEHQAEREKEAADKAAQNDAGESPAAPVTADSGQETKLPLVRLLADAGVPLSVLRENLGKLRDLGVEEVRLVTQSENTP